MSRDHGGSKLLASSSPRTRRTLVSDTPAVEPRRRDTQQLEHPSYREHLVQMPQRAGLLRLDEPVGDYRSCSLAKKAAAFFQERHVLFQLGVAATKLLQLPPFVLLQRSLRLHPLGLLTRTLIEHPLAQGLGVHREFQADIPQRPARIDHQPSSITPELLRVTLRLPRSGHNSHPPARPQVSPSGVRSTGASPHPCLTAPVRVRHSAVGLPTYPSQRREQVPAQAAVVSTSSTSGGRAGAYAAEVSRRSQRDLLNQRWASPSATTARPQPASGGNRVAAPKQRRISAPAWRPPWPRRRGPWWPR